MNHPDIGSICSDHVSLQSSQLHEIVNFVDNFSTSARTTPSIEYDKKSLIKEGFKPALMEPPLRQTRSGRNVKKPSRFHTNHVHQSSNWYDSVRASVTPSMRLFPIISAIPNDGPTDLLHQFLQSNAQVTSNRLQEYINLLRSDVRDPEQQFLIDGKNINYDQLSYVQRCDTECDDKDD
jgi:hypothetical protein